MRYGKDTRHLQTDLKAKLQRAKATSLLPPDELLELDFYTKIIESVGEDVDYHLHATNVPCLHTHCPGFIYAQIHSDKLKTLEWFCSETDFCRQYQSI